MSTTKEKVLAYFKEWDGKGINPANGAAIVTRNYGDWAFYEVCMDGAAYLVHSQGHDLLDPKAIVAARILKLDTPRAAEIQWKEVNEHHWVGREYSVEYRGSGGWAAYCGSDRLGDHYLFPTLAAAKKACQDHKQERLEELL